VFIKVTSLNATAIIKLLIETGLIENHHRSLDAPNGACYVAASPVITYLNNASRLNSGARGD